MALAASSAIGGARSRLRELFTARDAARNAERLPPSDRVELRRELEDAVDLMREASDGSARLVRTQLARQALAKALVATAAAQQLSLDPSQVDWPDLDQAIAQLSSLPGSSRYLPAISLIAGDDVLTDAELRLLENLFGYIERLVDLRSPRDVLVTRWLRRLGFASSLLVIGWLVTRPANLARGKAVTSSSICPEMPPARLGEQQLGRAVDGIRVENSFAVCTDSQSNPWLTVDLGSPRSIQRVIVYPRSEGPWGIADLPQEILVSLDDEHFQTVGAQTKLYTIDFPWTLELPETRARYVQLKGVHARKKLVLSEIEVYER